MSDSPSLLVEKNPWLALRQHTDARIALGRVGASLPTEAMLAFDLAHALARDAVHAALDVPRLAADLAAIGLASTNVTSQAHDRAAFLLRPDLGRRLHPQSALDLGRFGGSGDVAFLLGDGLSAVAVQTHAVPLLAALIPRLDPALRLAPVVIATQARVALGDEAGALLGARVVVVLIGERPGLSSPDSLGAYLTHGPRPGRTDAERNCVSNIRPAGLGFDEAARKLGWLVREALARGLSGVPLKDDSDVPALPDEVQDRGGNWSPAPVTALPESSS